MTKDEAREFLARINQFETIIGEDKQKILSFLLLTEPVESYNDQRCWTDVYKLAGIEYHVCYCPEDNDPTLLKKQ